MVKRRTRALFEFGVAAVGLLVQIRLWKAVRTTTNGATETIPASP